MRGHVHLKNADILVSRGAARIMQSGCTKHHGRSIAPLANRLCKAVAPSIMLLAITLLAAPCQAAGETLKAKR